jgi:Bacterial Ig-like domain (group 3)/FG-GAP-like repeat
MIASPELWEMLMRTSKMKLLQFAFIPSIKIFLAILIVVAGVCACLPIAGASPIPTTTTLAVSSNTVNAGTAVTLTATVMFEATYVTQGMVAFCDANAPHCEGSAMFGTAQLTSRGTATLKVILGVDSYSINAVFLGVGGKPSSTSIAQSLTVSGNSSYVSATTIAAGGSAGNYTLTGSVAAFGRPVPTSTVSFQDTSNGNFVLGTEALDPSTLGSNLLAASASSSVGNSVSCAATADFNLDGKIDLAVCNSNSTVSVLLGNGDGTFRSQMTYGTDPHGTPYAIATGDFNGDGNTDLAVTNSLGGSSDTVSILLGNGDGTFQNQQTYAVGSGAQGITVGDFDDDGNADLAIANNRDNTVSVLFGNGDGTFQPQVTYAAGNQPSSISAVDFNGDGHADLVVSNLGDNTVSVLLANRDGTFQAQVTYPTGNYPVGVTAGDFNGDGNADLAVANGNDGTVGVLLGNGDGTFQSQVTYPTGNLPVGVITGDFNGDGKADLATPNLVANNVSVLLGDGDGTFQGQATYSAGSQPMGIAVADFNGDGLADVATASHSSSGTITVLLSERTETATVTGVSMYGPQTHNVLASYTGDASRAASQSNTTALVGVAWPTTTRLSASANPGTAGQPITFTATVNSIGTGTPSGTVRFRAGTTLLGTGTVNNAGVATLTTSGLAVGAYSAAAAYSGDSNFGPSTSTALSLTMQTAPTYTVNTPQTTVSVTQGSSTNVTINLLPVGGPYNSSITLSASGLPAGVTATFNPASVTPGSAGASSVMTIQTSVQSASIPQENNHKTPLAPVSLAVGVSAFAGKRKRFSQSLAILLAFATMACGTILLTGCAGLGAKTQSQSQTQSRNYVVTIEGSSGSHNASTNVTLVLQ